MIATSSRYKQEMEETLRGSTDVTVSFFVTDPDAVALGTVTSNGELPFSSVADILSQEGYQSRILLETGRWLTDGLSDLSETNQGYISSEVSNSSGTFTSNPVVTLSFSSGVSFPALQLIFDTFRGAYPKEILVTAINSSAVTVVSASTTIIVGAIISVERAFHDITEIQIEFALMYNPLDRARLAFVGLGKTLEYKSDDVNSKLISAEQTRYVDITNATLPEYLFSFTIDNTDKSLNPEEEDNIFNYITARQPIDITWRYTLEAGRVQAIPGGRMLTTGEVASSGKEITISASSRLSFMDKIYSKGVYSSAGTSYYDLAVAVLEDSDLPNDWWNIDETLKDYYTHAPLPILSGKALLQLIAGATNSALYTTVKGYITIKYSPTTEVDFYLSEGKQIVAFPVLDQKPTLKSTTVYSRDYIPASSSTTIFSKDFDGLTLLTINYDSSSDISTSVTAGTVEEENLYAGYAEILVSGTGTLTVTGKKLSSTSVSEESYTDISRAQVQGGRCIYDNPLITSTPQAQEIAKYLFDVYINRNTYSGAYRGRADLEPLDVIYADNTYSSYIKSQIWRNSVSLDNTGFKGNAQWRGVQ